MELESWTGSRFNMLPNVLIQNKQGETVGNIPMGTEFRDTFLTNERDAFDLILISRVQHLLKDGPSHFNSTFPKRP